MENLSLTSKTVNNHDDTILRWADDVEIDIDGGYSYSISNEEDTASDYDAGEQRSSLNPLQEIWNTEQLWSELLDLPDAEEIHKLALENDVEEILKKNNKTGLLILLWLGKPDGVKKLLEQGISPDTADFSKRSALHLCAYSGRTECLKLLLDRGALVNVWDETQLVTPLHCAAGAGHLNCVRLLIKYGADVNAGINYRSPLHYAVQNFAVDCARELLQHNAIPNTPQVFSEAPIHVAAAMGNSPAIKLLLSHGAAVNVQCGVDKMTPLHLASEHGDAECAKLLIDAGAIVGARNRKKQTALHLAALAQCTEIMELLLRKGANPNAADADGRTPLHCSTVNVQRSCECVRILLAAGADVNRQDSFGYTPMHLAALNEFSNCVLLFLNHGGDVTVKTNGGISVLNFITKKTPEVMPKYVAKFDHSIKLNNHELGDVDCQLKLDFRILVPTMGNQETSLLLNFIDVGHKEILKHPLCETFLFLKWRRIRKFFLFSLIYHFIFVFLFSFYIIGVFLKNCPSFRSTRVTYCLVADYIKNMGYTLLILNILLLFKELFQICHSWLIYVKEWENWLQWSIIVCIFCCVQPIPNMNIREHVYTWQHHVAAIGIFLAWVELMMIVGRFPVFGLYVQMFTTVSINFTKFMLAYFCLFIAFALSFGVIFPNYKSFKDLRWVLIKVIIMMSGELEYEDVFFTEGYEVKYPYTAHIAYLTFVLLVTVILTNLMVGLAVSDIQGLQQSAGLDRLVRQAKLVAHLESMLFSKLLTFVPRKVMSFFHGNALLLKSRRDWTLDIRPNDPREGRIPKDLIQSVYQLVAQKKDKTKSKSFRRNRTVRCNRPISTCSSTNASERVGHNNNRTAIARELENVRNELSLEISRILMKHIENYSPSQGGRYTGSSRHNSENSKVL